MTKALSHDVGSAPWVEELNKLGENRQAALFIIDFEGKSARIWPTATLDPRILQFNFRGVGNDLSAPPCLKDTAAPAATAAAAATSAA